MTDLMMLDIDLIQQDRKARERNMIMRFFIQIFFMIILSALPAFLSAEQIGRHISIEQIVIDENTTIPAGAEVNFLGVLDVTLGAVPSGKLATFTYKNQVLNADAALFYSQNTDKDVAVYPPRTFDTGGSASMCSTLAKQSDGKTLAFADDSYQNYIELTSAGKSVDAYSITRQADIFSWRDSNSEFCINGLAHSTNYQLRILPDLALVRQYSRVATTTPITIAFQTPAKSPTIKVDASKSIIADPTNVVMPIEYTNVSEIEVTLHKVDLASLSSYEDVLKILDGSDISRLQEFWGEEVAKKTIELDAPLNQTQKLNLNFNAIIGKAQPGLFVATFTSSEIDLGGYENRPTQWFSISDIALQFYKGLNQSDIFLTSFTDATTVGEAQVRIVAANNKTLFDGASDKTGRVQVSNKLLNGKGGFAPKFLIVTSQDAGTSVLELNDINQKPRFLSGGRAKSSNVDVYVTADRGVYRPGETIHVVGAARQLDLAPVAKHDLTLRLVNRSEAEVYKAQVLSNEFGAFAQKIALKTTLPLGQYSVQILSIDEVVLAEHRLNISDFVPLTIEATLETENDYWAISEQQEISLNGAYYSGGQASDLSAEIVTFLQEVSTFQNANLSEFIFGSSRSTTTKELDSFGQPLDGNGELKVSVLSDYQFEKDKLYDVVIEGTIYDVGGRANKVNKRVSLDTLQSYVGVRPDFEEYVSKNVPPSFTIASVDREGAPVEFDGVTYTINKVYYDYNWYYDDGWRWNAVRVSDKIVETGQVSEKSLTLTTPLSWGRHEIIIQNSHGFRTSYEFYVGWGANTKPASEPEQLSFAFDGKTVRGKAPFSGTLAILVASQDIQSVVRTEVQQGEFEVPLEINGTTEPGIHLLASLVRPITSGSEHLPQLALGKAWVASNNANRQINLQIDAPTQTNSQTHMDISIATDAANGSAMVFVVDEGIHAISGFKNDNIVDHYLGERALNYGIFSNFGKLISQDDSLRSIRVGGDGDMLSAAAEAPKSEFFKTFVQASPLLEITDGKANYRFDKTDEWEGRLRVVVVALSDTGFGFSETTITVQDPISIDVSMPRFVAPNDVINAKMNLRWNEYEGPVELTTSIGKSQTRQTISQPTAQLFSVDLPITAVTEGSIPVTVEVQAGEHALRRTYQIVSRNASYPVTETQSTRLQKQNWVGLGSTLVQPYNARLVDLDLPGSTFSASLTTSVGIDLHQVVSELNKYPYGCIEQVSSKTRGLLALSKVKGLNDDLSQRIQLGIDNLLAKQKLSGAFGYWSRNSRVYEVYQPYAVDTLQQLLPYADNQSEVVKAINEGLEYLYRSNFDDQHTKLYAYGILARSGYEVTSRARYAIDLVLSSKRPELLNSYISDTKLQDLLEEFTIAYWTAVGIKDAKRTVQISEKVRFLLDRKADAKSSFAPIDGAWYSSEHLGKKGANRFAAAPKNAHLLTQLDADVLTSELREVVENTRDLLSQQNYRSTQGSAKLVALQTFTRQSVAGVSVTIDDTEYVINESGSLPLTNEQLKFGFEISQDANLPLYLNVKATGQRRSEQQINNGYKVTKWWYDRSGTAVELKDGLLTANQGDLFTVVIEIDRTRNGTGSDILLTDLLPTGFEIENATIADPQVNGVKLDLSEGRTPVYIGEMDDRLIAHFDDRWRQGSFAFVRYTVRAAYQANAQIPDATVEEMYTPEINGRSLIQKVTVQSR